MKELLNKTLEKAKILARRAEEVLKTGGSTKAQRDEVRELAARIAQDIESNLGFAMSCVDQKLEKNIAHAKSEIESFVDMKFKSAGIEYFKGQAPALLEDKTDGHI